MRILSRNKAVNSPSVYSIEPFDLGQWQYIESYLKVSDANAKSQSEIDAAMVGLPSVLVLQAYSDLIRATFERKIVPAIKQVVPSAANFVSAAQNLEEGLTRYEACFARLKIRDGGITSVFQALVQAHITEDLWSSSIRSWIEQAVEDVRDDDLQKLHATSKHIGLSKVFEKGCNTVLSGILARTLRDTYASNWGDSCLDAVSTTTVGRTRTLLHKLDIGISDDQTYTRLLHGLAKLRIHELFDIIVDFPSSAAAVEDLKTCIKSTDTRASLVNEFQAQCRARLLHPGANTPDIIAMYIATIRVFLLLDPPGVLLDRVARPIRAYLRERTDTIRCIIGALLGEVESDLALELSIQDNENEVDDEDDPNWVPDPIDAAPDYTKNRASDIVGSLVSIYENKDVFARELQALLADRLLAVTDFNIDQELHNMELLKVRFGDEMLGVCDVMLKDMNDSRRVDIAVHESQEDRIEAHNLVHSTIVSRLYWPELKSKTFSPRLVQDEEAIEEGFRLPSEITKMLEEYSRQFARLKAQRSLVFQKDLGHVRIKLEFEDRELDMVVTPTHAATIHLFDSTASRSLEQIQEMLNLPELDCKRNLLFWVKQGVLAVDAEVYTVVEVADAPGQASLNTTMEEVLPDVIEEVDEMSMYWNFIVGMLTNVGALELERVHSMLGMFAPSYDRSTDQLRAFLQKRSRAGDVELAGGLYKLPAV